MQGHKAPEFRQPRHIIKKGVYTISNNEITAKVRRMKRLQAKADELDAEIKAIQDEIKAEIKAPTAAIQRCSHPCSCCF